MSAGKYPHVPPKASTSRRRSTSVPESLDLHDDKLAATLIATSRHGDVVCVCDEDLRPICDLRATTLMRSADQSGEETERICQQSIWLLRGPLFFMPSRAPFVGRGRVNMCSLQRTCSRHSVRHVSPGDLRSLPTRRHH